MHWDASKPTRNGFVHPERDANADWRNGCQSPITLGENQMAQVTYRGVKYNTNDSKTQQTNKVDLVYRGVKLEKELVANKWC